MSIITLNEVSRTFGSGPSKVGLRSIDLEVVEGEFVTLLGPSGCGKTTTLRCIAGLERPDRGTIEIAGKTMVSAGGRNPVFVQPEGRGISMVFQNYALWPHLSVFENVAFGLRRQRQPKSAVKERVEDALRMIGLPAIADRRVSQLSGGQQQRVALARAMAPRPKVVLFDEPLSNIDTRLRESMRLEVLRVQQETGVTVVWVTHDQEEALSMSSRIVVMNDGLVEQVGTPSEVWNRPSSEFVAEFMGSKNIFRGTVVELTHGETLMHGLSLKPDVVLPLPTDWAVETGQMVTACAGNGAFRVGPVGSIEGDAVFRADVIFNRFHGDYYQLSLRLGTAEMRITTDQDVVGQASHVDVTIDSSSLAVLGDSD